jgi:hypothetical protein
LRIIAAAEKRPEQSREETKEPSISRIYSRAIYILARIGTAAAVGRDDHGASAAAGRQNTFRLTRLAAFITAGCRARKKETDTGVISGCRADRGRIVGRRCFLITDILVHVALHIAVRRDHDLAAAINLDTDTICILFGAIICPAPADIRITFIRRTVRRRQIYVALAFGMARKTLETAIFERRIIGVMNADRAIRARALEELTWSIGPHRHAPELLFAVRGAQVSSRGGGIAILAGILHSVAAVGRSIGCDTFTLRNIACRGAAIGVLGAGTAIGRARWRGP